MTSNEQQSGRWVLVTTGRAAWRAVGFAIAAVALSLAGFVRSSTAATPEEGLPVVDRELAQQIIRDLRAVTTPGGIEELKAVEIGGIPQWLSVRGKDRNNPILLFIHGGPGFPEMPASWFYQTPWEEFFTVVQWDQRGAGRTMTGSTPEAVHAQVSVERMIADAVEVVGYLRKTYGKEKIFVLGHSWGSVLGLELARRHPSWLHAYVGMGQYIELEENERLGYEFALRSAREAGNDTAVAELSAIAPYPKPDRRIEITDVLTQRKWLTYFGGMTRGRSGLEYEVNARLLSPDYGLDDLRSAQYEGVSAAKLAAEFVNIDFSKVNRLDCPVFVLAGRSDYAVSSVVAERWFSKLKAPVKKLVWFEQSSHMLQFEEPGKLLLTLVR
ncbi:MAG TPA: alpha/beta hydrolase, partial [Steroidobacter sp.]|uniref:alpha/beta fold hydrolase n=1 Tax=Steroidobacter sp. TaxID=1978227 RepID=UPI002ED85398